MKKLIIGILLGMMAMIGCGDDDSKPKAGICEMCNQDSDCESDLSCDELYDLDTWLPVGKYCIDSPTRVCEIGGGGRKASCQAACEKLDDCGLWGESVEECVDLCEEDLKEEDIKCIMDTPCDKIVEVCSLGEEFEASCRKACEKLEECGFIIGFLEDCVDGCEEALKDDYEQTMKEIECFIVTPCEDIIEDCFGI